MKKEVSNKEVSGGEQTQQSYVLDAVVKMSSYEDETTKEVREYVGMELVDPFGDEDFRDVSISPKWDDAREIFKFRAKKALRTAETVPFKVTLKVMSYDNKKKRTVTYPGLMGISPFDGRQIEFIVKGKRALVFDELARIALGLPLRHISSSDADEAFDAVFDAAAGVSSHE